MGHPPTGRMQFDLSEDGGTDDTTEPVAPGTCCAYCEWVGGQLICYEEP